jgi:hypothetical protein
LGRSAVFKEQNRWIANQPALQRFESSFDTHAILFASFFDLLGHGICISISRQG